MHLQKRSNGLERWLQSVGFLQTHEYKAWAAIDEVERSMANPILDIFTT
jgi:hypothetical protein